MSPTIPRLRPGYGGQARIPTNDMQYFGVYKW